MSNTSSSVEQQAGLPEPDSGILGPRVCGEEDAASAALDAAHRAMPELPFLGMTQTIAYRNDPPAPIDSSVVPLFPDEQFWFGAGDDFDFQIPGSGDASWQRDEAEMRALIDGELDKLIDPALEGAGAVQ